MLPVLNRLDHEPRDEFDEDIDGAIGGAGWEGRWGQVGDMGLVWLPFFVRLK